jgi:hypothetical protein
MLSQVKPMWLYMRGFIMIFSWLNGQTKLIFTVVKKRILATMIQVKSFQTSRIKMAQMLP